jgi:HK97 family phage major capsid protein
VTDPNVTAFATAAGTAGAFGEFSSYYVRDAGLRFEVSTDYAFANDLVTYRTIHRLDGKILDSNGIRTLKDPTT